MPSGARKNGEIDFRQWSILAVGLCLFIFLRVLAAADDFTLDEIWSLLIVEDFSRLELLTEVRHDNNHILNSFFLSFIESPPHWAYYRIPSLIFGSLTVLLLALLRIRKGFRHAALVLLLSGSSFTMIVYASEARGYAAAAFFAVAGYALIKGYSAYPGLRKIVIPAYWTVILLGFLAQFSFVFAYGALFIWSLALSLNRQVPGRSIKTWLLLQGVPMPLLAALYFMVFRKLLLGHVYPESMSVGIGHAIAFTFGMPSEGFFFWAAYVGYAALIGYCLFRARSRDEDAVFYLLALCIVPLIILTGIEFKFFFHRYLFVVVPFAYLAMSDALMRLNASGCRRGLLAAGLLAAFVAGNARYNYDLIFREGRGSYAAAAREILNDEKTGSLRVGHSWGGVQHAMLLNFYAKHYGAKNRIRFFVGPYHDTPLDWFILNRTSDKEGFKSRLSVEGQPFVHAGSFRRAVPVSGWNWELYRRVEEDKRLGAD